MMEHVLARAVEHGIQHENVIPVENEDFETCHVKLLVYHDGVYSTQDYINLMYLTLVSPHVI